MLVEIMKCITKVYNMKVILATLVVTLSVLLAYQDNKIIELEKQNTILQEDIQIYEEYIFGEDIPNDWELLDEEVVDGEHL